MSPGSQILRRVWTIDGCKNCPFAMMDPAQGLAWVCQHPGEHRERPTRDERPHPAWCPLVEAPTQIMLRST